MDWLTITASIVVGFFLGSYLYRKRLEQVTNAWRICMEENRQLRNKGEVVHKNNVVYMSDYR